MAKRALDITVSLVLLVVLSPLMLITAIVIARGMGRPVLFRHMRAGLNGKSFVLYKFRTMTQERDSNGKLLPDNERRTPFGEFVRKTSLDELPELINILIGDMSLVGPRPLVPQYLPRYTPEQARRHEVKPGLTGLAQISGRHLIPFSKRFELDVYYVDHQSFLLDLKILLLTIPQVLGARGVVPFQPGLEIDDIGLDPALDGARNQRV